MQTPLPPPRHGHASAHLRNFQVTPHGPHSDTVAEFGHRAETLPWRRQMASSWTNRAIHKPDSSVPFPTPAGSVTAWGTVRVGRRPGNTMFLVLVLTCLGLIKEG